VLAWFHFVVAMPVLVYALPKGVRAISRCRLVVCSIVRIEKSCFKLVFVAVLAFDSILVCRRHGRQAN
jgi:hypothetical protein